MQYMFLIYENESLFEERDEQQKQQIMQDYFAFTTEVKEKGVFVAGDPLMPIDTATSVRLRNGKTLATDGPFAETKEQLGGYYILDCKDLEEALDYGARIPTAVHGTIEVRPIMVFPT